MDVAAARLSPSSRCPYTSFVIVMLDGTTMRDERGFHRNLAAALCDRLRVDYGENLDALKDVVSLEIEGPLDIHPPAAATGS